MSWWRDAVVYQIYVRSFGDSNGDGLGDLAGIIRHLDHIAELGADAIWLTPCYPSPQRDHGYDVADYVDIDPRFGDLATFDRLVASARALGIRVLMDVVPNHCSSDHAWFRAALAAAPGSAERRRFFFRDGKGDEPPNDWRAVFGGSAWTRVVEPDGQPGQWYLHTFTPWQPDFDWTCDDVVTMFDEVLTFWFDRGVDGFRADAVTLVGKAPGLPDAGTVDGDVWTINAFTTFWPTGHDVWRRWRALTDEYERTHPGRELLLVSEAYTPDRPDILLQYAAPDEFHQSFCFDLMLAPWDVDAMRSSIASVYDAFVPAGAAMTWTLNNHDTQRAVTRYGRADATSTDHWSRNNLVYTDAPVDVALGTARARAAITFVAALPGALYLYQGEELGLPEVLDLPAAARQDPIFVRTGGRELGRDGCRVPIPWTLDRATAFGFSDAAATWLPQPSTWGAWSVEAEQDAASVLTLYRALLAQRRSRSFGDAPLTWIDLPGVLAFRRADVVVALNVGSSPVRLPFDGLVLSSTYGHVDPSLLPADTCAWLVPTREGT